MIRSLTEIEAMLLKAARGAGVPFGNAEDFAAAGRFLLATSPAHIADLSIALEAGTSTATLENDNTIVRGPVTFAAPCAIDLMLCDHLQVTLQDVDAPALCHAYVAYACHTRGLSVDVSHDGASITLTQAPEVEILQPRAEPVEIADTVWAQWDRYAANTYVPATEASRLAGAGAGLTDND